jgi:type I restriction-modification system DNA methylase subunit
LKSETSEELPMPKKDKNDTAVYRHLMKLVYRYTWDQYTSNININEILKKASKNGSGHTGVPDDIYVNENEKLLILVEVKPTVSEHISKDGHSEPAKYAVDGAKWYADFFKQSQITKESMKQYFNNWKIVSIAVSGDISDEYNHKISTFILSDDELTEQRNITEFLNESDYLNLFENVNEEKIISNVSTSSRLINKWLRSVDSQKRPILLSALMICLFKIKDGGNSFLTEYNSNKPSEIVKKIPDRVNDVLKSENISEEKRDVLIAELEFIKHDVDFNNTDVLKNILNELGNNVIPLFNHKRSNYDIIGKFYEEFLRYAGVANVKKGIVLTPNHVTKLFTELVEMKANDVVMDCCCGTGSFLISGMNKLTELIEESSMPNKEDKIRKIKKTQLIGFEKNPTMYSLAISNMLFRGDGKSTILNLDYFSDKADKELEKLKLHRDDEGNLAPIMPTVGFINPPYGGKDNKENPTKKEIQFLTKLLDQCSRYVVMIAPLSAYFKDESIRNAILAKHTLKCVINMPHDLFMPNAATNTAISVFETNAPQGDKEAVFYDLDNDGFVLSKGKGRTDIYNKWNCIKEDLLEKLRNPHKYEDKLKLVITPIGNDDEWLIQAHSRTDYSKLSNVSFENSIKEYMVFKAKEEMNLLDVNIDEITLINLLNKRYGGQK